MREVDEEAVSVKLNEESTADAHEIITIYSKEKTLYRVVWLYVWKSLNCGGLYFHADTFLITPDGQRSHEGEVPSIRTGRAVCVH